MNFRRLLILASAWAALCGGKVRAQLIFSDSFTTAPSASWGNEVGSWSAAGGVYSATAISNNPPTYSSLPYSLTDFSVTVTINALQDGGIWLRSSSNANGILLVTGGRGGAGSGLYWHEIVNGNWSTPAILSEVTGLFTPGSSTATITVKVIGNTYSAFVNGSSTPATTLTSSLFASGKVALYDYSGQTFDDFSLTVIPEASEFGVLAGALALLVGTCVRRRRRAVSA